MAVRSFTTRLPFLVLLVAGSASALPFRTRSTSPPTSKNVIAQMFQWNWDSIAAECTDFLGPAGYGFVQTSPPQEAIPGDEWFTVYQPVSYNLDGRFGTRDQFANMVKTCHAAGVGVIIDAVWNHMTGGGNGTSGTAGSQFSKFNYPGIYTQDNFHNCGLEANNEIKNFNNAVEVHTCELEGLADLATDTEAVRSKLAAYGNDLISLGVDGFRLDAAKHIDPVDVKDILGRLSKDVYTTQEVAFGANEAVEPEQYISFGGVQEFRYTSTLKSAFSGNGNSISTLKDIETFGFIPGTTANVFVANHDTERSGASLTFQDSPSNTYENAMVFSLAFPYGTPTILSSYSFTDFNQGAPNNNFGKCSATGGAEGFICQHRFLDVAGMVGFHNTAGSDPVTNWVSPAAQQIAFGRGSSAFVAINNADEEWTTTFATSLPEGTYCEVTSGQSQSGSCSGTSLTVSSSGSISTTVAARTSIAVHIGQKL